MKAALFLSLFPHALEIELPYFTRKDSIAHRTTRTLSRIDRAIVNLPMVEARDFRSYSDVFENLGERFIPSDRAAVLRVGCPNIPLSALF